MSIIIFQYKNEDGLIEEVPVSYDEIAERMEEFAFEKLCKCECEPVGETNNIECSCSEKYEDFTFLGMY